MTIQERFMVPEENQKAESGSGTDYGYKLEARFNYHTPKRIGDLILDNRWREVPWFHAKHGIPRPNYLGRAETYGRLLTRNEAEAHRWVLACVMDADKIGGSICLETRLVKVRVTYDYKCEKIEYVGAQDMRGSIPEDMKVEQEQNAKVETARETD